MPHPAMIARRPLKPLAFFAWYDASQITGFADNTGLTTWHDASGNGWDLTNPTSPPRYYSTTAAKLVNGLPAVWGQSGFTLSIGRSDPAMTHARPITVACVISGTPLPVVGGTGIWTTGGFVELYPTAGQGYSQNNQFKTGTVDSSTHVVISVMNDAASSITIDGVTTTGDLTGTAQNITGSINLFNVSSAYFFGAICEVKIKSGAYTAAQIAAEYSSLKTKWGAV